jgi:hypothetical protein
MDSDDFFKKLREQREELGATGTKLDHTNKDGLDRKSAAREVKAAAGSGHSRITLTGTDKEGVAIKRTNQDVIVRETATFEPSTPKENSMNMFAALTRVIARGLVAVPTFARDAGQKLAGFINKYVKDPGTAAPAMKALPDPTTRPSAAVKTTTAPQVTAKKTVAKKRTPKR